MKDEYKRRRKLERPLIRTLSDVDSAAVFTPAHQECLDMDCAYGSLVATQGNEFIVTSSDEWWLEVYGLSNDDSTASFNLDSVSEISDDTVLPNRTRKSLWRAVPNDPELKSYGDVMFLAPDVLGIVRLEARPGTLSTWNVRSGLPLESIVLRGGCTFKIVCKISNTEFVAGSLEGHMFSFEHEQGCNLRETGRVWKAHAEVISSISCHNGTMLTTSGDCSARLWDAGTKKRVAVLYHDHVVLSGAISDQHIVTCSRYGRSLWEKSELRIYRNGEGYPLTKILRTHEGIFEPALLSGDRILCILAGDRDENFRPLVRHTLVVVDFGNEGILAELKVGCRGIVWYKVLSDGRIVVIGYGGCRGVIATPPRDLARLISPTTTEKHSESGRRRTCTLM